MSRAPTAFGLIPRRSDAKLGAIVRVMERAMPEPLPISCACGTVRGRLEAEALPGGTHLVCYCKDCRAFARHLGAEADLTPGGGSPLFQTTPDLLSFEAGEEHVACLRLGPKGILRWYADCCNTPLANTLPKPGIPFVGLLRAAVPVPHQPALGPVIAEGFTKYALPHPAAPGRDRGVARLFLRFLRRTLAAWITRRTGSWFFDGTGLPVRRPRVLTREERRAAEQGG